MNAMGEAKEVEAGQERQGLCEAVDALGRAWVFGVRQILFPSLLCPLSAL